MDDEVKSDPAYFPGAVSAMTGGLCPEIRKELPGADLTVSTEKKKLGMEENFLSIIYYF